MIGYVVNYKDPDKRARTPSGLLVIHPVTKQVLATGKSSLSWLLVGHYTLGFQLAVQGAFAKVEIVKTKPYNPESYESLAPRWYDKAGLHFEKISVTPPLSAFVPVAGDLSAAYNKEPFEKIHIAVGRTRKE